MSTLSPSLILIGPFPRKLSNLGAEIFTDLSSATSTLELSSCEVLAISLTALREKKMSALWPQMQKHRKETQLILISPDAYRSQDLVALYKEYPLFRWRTRFDEEVLAQDLVEALEHSRSLQQQSTMNRLRIQQTQELESFQAELEKRVEKRTRYLVESRRKLFLMSSRMEVFRELLIRFQTTTTAQDLEAALNERLNAWMDLQWIRLVVGINDHQFLQDLNQGLDYQKLGIPLFHGDHRLGSLYFLRSLPQEFSLEETEFLRQVGEVVALALERLLKAADLQALKFEWDSTFQAIADPVLLIDQHYSVLQSNRDSTSSHLKCYEVLFQRSSPCLTCQRGENFFLGQSGETFQVTSQTVGSTYLNLYHNKTHELRMEAQILESARSAELGTIGSSIAHELNNPLGGLLTFVQMIQRDLPEDSPWIEDIKEMENGAHRCRDIIQDLLMYTRPPETLLPSQMQTQTQMQMQSQPQPFFDLVLLTQQTLKALEIAAKTFDVELEFRPPTPTPWIQGNPSLISQALRSILQSLIQSSSYKKISIDISFNGSELLWRLQTPAKIQLQPLRSTNFSWALANQILLDQSAEMVSNTEVGPGTILQISFSRLVSRS